jgi:filamentous hemagglutinin family protein
MATKFPKPSIAVPAFFILDLIGGGSAQAQIATDGSVGPRIELNGPEFDIGAEFGRQAGRNLFHSFDRFSLSTGERATFSGPDQIRNVISRVTGGERSDIDGTIRSTIEGADFYFINPAGVLFGPNARLDVKGSFHVSTADELRFEGGEVFSADLEARSSSPSLAPRPSVFLAIHPPRFWSTGPCSGSPPVRRSRSSAATSTSRMRVSLPQADGSRCWRPALPVGLTFPAAS